MPSGASEQDVKKAQKHIAITEQMFKNGLDFTEEDSSGLGSGLTKKALNDEEKSEVVNHIKATEQILEGTFLEVHRPGEKKPTRPTQRIQSTRPTNSQRKLSLLEGSLDSLIDGILVGEKVMINEDIETDDSEENVIAIDEARMTHLSSIIDGLVKNPAFNKKVDSWYIQDGAVALVSGKDGNAYEVVVRPASLGKFKRLFKKYIEKREK